MVYVLLSLPFYSDWFWRNLGLKKRFMTLVSPEERKSHRCGRNYRYVWNEVKKLLFKRSIFNSLLLLRKVFPYLLVGTAIGALIHGLLPVSVVQKVAGIPAWFSVPAAALIGIPLYIRTETIIPMATVLQSVGLGPGVLVSLMIGGGGASLPEVSLLSSIFTKKMLAAFLISVFTVACATGFIFNSLLG